MVKNLTVKAKLLQLDREQRIGLSNIFVGYSIAGGVGLFSYWGGKLDVSLLDANSIAIATFLSAFLSLIFRKEKS